MQLTPDDIARIHAGSRPTRDDEGKPIRRCLRRGVFGRRVIAESLTTNWRGEPVEIAYHATKGYRARRIGR